MSSAAGAGDRMITKPKPRVQMAILLDTSGSMSGLIDQARTELWAIVNEFITARRDGQAPELQVALYQYGKGSLPASEGYLRMVVPLTMDLDKISEELFALKISGSQEYCGWVIKEATEELQWSTAPEDLKVIFIAGNEPFTQGKVKHQDACKAAIAKGIIVNTIHCGSSKDGINGKWKDGAMLADGQFLNIDQNKTVVHIAAPQDTEIAELGIKLNSTYIAYGRRGRIASERQSEQDSNASSSSRLAATQRAVTKSSLNYRNDSWDLVDGLKNDAVKLEDVKKEDLPKEMQDMSDEEQKAYVEQKTKQRAQIQQKIQKLNDARKKYVAEEMKKQATAGKTLGSAAIKAIRLQAEKKNFKFEASSSSSKVE
jgi:hypothetical protein